MPQGIASHDQHSRHNRQTVPTALLFAEWVIRVRLPEWELGEKRSSRASWSGNSSSENGHWVRHSRFPEWDITLPEWVFGQSLADRDAQIVPRGKRVYCPLPCAVCDWLLSRKSDGPLSSPVPVDAIPLSGHAPGSFKRSNRRAAVRLECRKRDSRTRQAGLVGASCNHRTFSRSRHKTIQVSLTVYVSTAQKRTAICRGSSDRPLAIRAVIDCRF